MKRFGLLLFFPTVIFSILLGISMQFGRSTVSPNAWLFEAGNCDQPCWHGIQLGKTNLDQAETLLRADQSGHILHVTRTNGMVAWESILQSGIKFVGNAYAWENGDIVNGVSLYIDSAYPDGLPITDVMLSLGLPDAFAPCSSHDLFVIGKAIVYVISFHWDQFNLVDFLNASHYPVRLVGIAYILPQPGGYYDHWDQLPHNWIGFSRLRGKDYAGACFGQ